MREITDEELDAATKDVLIVQQVTIVEMLFLFANAAIIAFVAFLYYPESRGQNLSHLVQDPSISQRSSSANQSK